MEVLDGNAGGAAELRLLLHRSVSVQDDQVTTTALSDWTTSPVLFTTWFWCVLVQVDS